MTMNTKTKVMIFSLLGITAAVGALFVYQSGKFTDLLAAHTKTAVDGDAENNGKPFVYRKPLAEGEVPLSDGKGDPGLRISEEARKGLTLEVKEAVAAVAKRALPPQLGTINYDNETMFQIKPRFPGELSAMSQVGESKEIFVNGSTRYVVKERPIKFGDKVKQGDVLVEFWSQTLGLQKAAFVDAICSLRLSQETLDRQGDLFKQGAMSLAGLKVAERQVQADNNAVMTAERTLRMWKLTNDEIKEIRDEANIIHDQKKSRDVVKEVERWARVQVKVPWFDKTEDGKKRELTILEKNTAIGDIVDNANYGTTLFRLADMSRLQIWVHPPEEYIPIIRKGLERNGNGNGKPKWQIRFQADAADKPPLLLDIEQIAPSFEPTQHNPMVIGYLDNKDHHYFVGQAVTATIFVYPELDTVEIPTDALNEVKGQSFVFVRDDKDKNEYSCRRVSVVQRFKNYSIVRSKLADEHKKFSEQEVKQGRWPLRPLLANDLVVTRGVVELTTALENLLVRAQANELAQQK
jgi:multidrug efflux pump subunit AcrA (membrane-fusion protein)